jgi:peptidoglycan/xylan/chitin deacetylase (PgdA/CDA1 family)
MKQSGIFTVSLDFERMWGVHDVAASAYAENIDGVDVAIDRLLEVFNEYGIHTTWATVGLLFFNDLNELNSNLPDKKPQYASNLMNSYEYINRHAEPNQVKHFSLDTILKISKVTGQEIGTHTFSHYYCQESGQSINEFDSDIKAAVKIASKFNFDVNSLVFPRNQYNAHYLEVLRKYNIKSFRGNEEYWVYRDGYKPDDSYLKRGLRLLDSYLNISGNNCYSLEEISKSFPHNISSSYFLRPYSEKLKYFDNFKEKRILDSMTHAAKNNLVFHLWWHPHNFGVNLEKNMSLLLKIIQHYDILKNKYDMISLNMGEISNIISLHSIKDDNLDS